MNRQSATAIQRGIAAVDALNNPSPLDELERKKADLIAAMAHTDAIESTVSHESDEWRLAIEADTATRLGFYDALREHADWLISAARDRETLREVNAMVAWRLQSLSETSELRRRTTTPTCILEFKQLLSNLGASLRDAARKGDGG